MKIAYGDRIFVLDAEKHNPIPPMPLTNRTSIDRIKKSVEKA